MKKLLIFFIVTLLLFPLVSSFMPPTHKYLNNKLLESVDSDSALYQKCISDPELCYAGNVLTDLSVVYYYTEDLKYVATHQPIWCQSLLQQAQNPAEDACAVGGCLHQTQDMVSHNKMVPYAIKHSGLVNEVIHTFAEQHMDNLVQDKYPGIKEEALDLERFDECRPLFKRVLEGNALYQDEIESGKFDAVVDKFLDEVSGSVTSYDISFRKKGGVFDNLRVIPTSILLIYIGSMLLFILLFGLILFKKGKSTFNYISLIFLLFVVVILVWLFIANIRGVAFVTFVKFITPISNIVPIGDADAYLQESIDNGEKFFDQGEGFLINTDASGFPELRSANKSIKLFDYGVLAVIGLLLFLFIYYNLRRRRA